MWSGRFVLSLIDIYNIEEFDFFEKASVWCEVRKDGKMLPVDITHSAFVNRLKDSNFHIILPSAVGFIIKETAPHVIAYQVPLAEYKEIIKMADMDREEYLTYYAALTI